jgi:hypothetical protein
MTLRVLRTMARAAAMVVVVAAVVDVTVVVVEAEAALAKMANQRFLTMTS